VIDLRRATVDDADAAAAVFTASRRDAGAERTDGALNEERAPDIRYVWTP